MSTYDEDLLIKLIQNPSPNDWEEVGKLFANLAQFHYDDLIRFSKWRKRNANHEDIEDAVCQSIEYAMLHLKNHFKDRKKAFVFGMEGQVQSFRRWIELILWNGSWGVLGDVISHPHQSISDADQASEIPDTNLSENLDVHSVLSEALSRLPTDQKWVTTLYYGLVNYSQDDPQWILKYALQTGYSLSDARRMQRRARDAELTDSTSYSYLELAKILDCSVSHVRDVLRDAKKKLLKIKELEDAFDDLKQYDLNRSDNSIYYIHKKKKSVRPTWIFKPNQITA